MTDAQEYAKRIASQYSVKLSRRQLSRVKNLTTIGEVASHILPQDKLDMWAEAEKLMVKKWRQEFNIEPYDKFDNDTLKSRV